MKTTSQKLLTAKETKKILLGICLSDGHINKNRFDFYSKHEEYAKFVFHVLEQITNCEQKFYVKKDKRGYVGYRVTTKSHVYWSKMYSYIYDARKELNSYSVSRIDELALAHIWMCDGYLEHQKNKKLNKVQNVGWFCLEAFPKDELQLLSDHLERKFGIQTTLISKPWGFGYRLRVGGENLQKLISTVYQHILPCFLDSKTTLFFKNKESANLDLPSAELYVKQYKHIDDIVRHSQK